MKCPNCNTVNGKTNKYCRQCGTRLEVLAPREPEPAPAPAADEVALGQELFAALEMFERGDLDAAFEKSSKLAADNPSSASAHSIVALIYERKAENAFADGDTQAAREFLKRAIEHYEAIIDLNPDSSADREKLASLRLRQAGGDASLPPVSFGSGVSIGRAGLRQRIRAIPIPAVAAAAALVVVVVLVVAVTGLTGRRPNTSRPRSLHEKPVVTVKPAESNEPAPRVYTFPPPESSLPRGPLAPTPVAPRLPRPPSAEVKPAKVPKIEGELTLVPEPKSQADKTEPAAKSPTSAPQDSTPPPAPVKPTGDSLLAKAITLHNNGDTSGAIEAAKQAIDRYQEEIIADKNPDRAKRGIDTAKKYISYWQAILASSSQ